MNFFVGIVPPEDIYRHIAGIQSQFGDNRLEPHITLRPPVIPTQQEDWIKSIETTAHSFKPFEVQLTGTGYFGKGVLFINVEAPQLHVFYDKLIPALQPFEPEADKKTQAYHPHLTLGRAWCGFTADDFNAMQRLADEYLSVQQISFTITHIRIYHKPEHGRFKVYKDVALLM